MKIQKAKGPTFFPQVETLTQAVFVVDRVRFDASLLLGVLAALNVPSERMERHVESLLSRHRGEMSWFSADVYSGKEYGSFPSARMMEAQGLPWYVYANDEGTTLSWMLDVFNPRNEECRLPCYNWDQEYLLLTVGDLDGHSNYRSRNPPPLSHFMPSQNLFNDLISLMHLTLGSSFVFGSADHHLSWFVKCCHFARYGPPRWLDFEKVAWQWAIYPPALQKKLNLDPEVIEAYDPISPHDANEALFVRRLSDGSILVFSIYDEPFEDARYAKHMGLKSILSLDLKEGV